MRRFFATLAMLVILSPSIASGDMKEIFRSRIDESIDRLVVSWIAEDMKGMDKAASVLVRYEAYLLAESKGSSKSSYLAEVPKALSLEKGLIPYLFLLRKKREKIDLIPVDLFEGESFYLKKEDK